MQRSHSIGSDQRIKISNEVYYAKPIRFEVVGAARQVATLRSPAASSHPSDLSKISFIAATRQSNTDGCNSNRSHLMKTACSESSHMELTCALQQIERLKGEVKRLTAHSGTESLLSELRILSAQNQELKRLIQSLPNQLRAEKSIHSVETTRAEGNVPTSRKRLAELTDECNTLRQELKRSGIQLESLRTRERSWLLERSELFQIVSDKDRIIERLISSIPPKLESTSLGNIAEPPATSSAAKRDHWSALSNKSYFNLPTRPTIQLSEGSHVNDAS